MPLSKAYVGALIIETIDNFARADDPLLEPRDHQASDSPPDGYFYGDGEFWGEILEDPEHAWGRTYHFELSVVLSEWVARVPGLYWAPDSERLRHLQSEAVELSNRRWQQYTPRTKSAKVMGGIGSLRLPPAVDGFRLASLTSSLNASTGVPVLLAPEVWEHHHLTEGKMVRGQGRWQPMTQGWSSQFPSVRGIPRGYLVVMQPDDLEVIEDGAPTQIHPFTVMEYYEESAELFDYVYATADTGDKRYRKNLEEFFESYKDDRERYGRYLLSGDMITPMWDALYAEPAELRRTDPAAGSQLAILEARVRERLLGGNAIEELLKVLGTHIDQPRQLTELSDEIGIPPATWFSGGNITEASSQLVDVAIERDRFEALIERCAIRFDTPTPSDLSTRISTFQQNQFQENIMTKKEALVQLDRLLVAVFFSRDDARRLAEQSGVDPTQIRDGDTLANYWWNVLVAAHQRNKVVDIVKNASWEVNERAAEFKQAYSAYADAEDTGEDIQPLGAQPAPSVSYNATLSGGGAIAQGPGAVAAGEGGVAVGGDVSGNIVAGNRNVVGNVGGNVDMSEHHVEQKGKYNVNIGEASGMAIGDDAKIVEGDEVHGDKVGGDKISTGDISGTGIAVGRGAQAIVHQGISGAELDKLFTPLMAAVASAPPDKRAEAEEDAEALKDEVAKGGEANDTIMAKLIDGLVTLAPGAVSAVTSMFATPILAGLAGNATKIVLAKIQGQ